MRAATILGEHPNFMVARTCILRYIGNVFIKVKVVAPKQLSPLIKLSLACFIYISTYIDHI